MSHAIAEVGDVISHPSMSVLELKKKWEKPICDNLLDQNDDDSLSGSSSSLEELTVDERSVLS